MAFLALNSPSGDKDAFCPPHPPNPPPPGWGGVPFTDVVYLVLSRGQRKFGVSLRVCFSNAFNSKRSVCQSGMFGDDMV